MLNPLENLHNIVRPTVYNSIIISVNRITVYKFRVVSAMERLAQFVSQSFDAGAAATLAFYRSEQQQQQPSPGSVRGGAATRCSPTVDVEAEDEGNSRDSDSYDSVKTRQSSSSVAVTGERAEEFQRRFVEPRTGTARSGWPPVSASPVDFRDKMAASSPNAQRTENKSDVETRHCTKSSQDDHHSLPEANNVQLGL